MSFKYTFHHHTGDKFVLETRGGESQRHIVLKTLGYVLFYADRPRIEIAVTEDKRDYRPDVVAFDAQGDICLWVDCGKITLQKVDDLTRQYRNAEIVVIKPTVHEMQGYASQAEKKVKQWQRVQFLAFDSEFVPGLIVELGHNNTLAWTRDAERLTLTLNGRTLTTTLWHWQGGRMVPCPTCAPEREVT